MVRISSTKAWLSVAILVLTPWLAHGAGLGKLTILSYLGQPLLAEIDLVSVQQDELTTLTARLAPPEAFQQANVPYSPALVGMRMSVERRPTGQQYIKVTSTRAVNEPFIDLLVELSWASGRLVREYTALIDPPAFAAAPAPVSPQPVPQLQPAQVETGPATQPVGPATGSLAAEEKPRARPAGPATASAAAKTYGPVKSGDTLAKIAGGVKPESVTLEQMLVALYRANPEAFVGNMNRLKTGKILRVPEQEQLAITGPVDAVREVRMQAADWNSYRRKLAEAPSEARSEDTRTTASGKITTKIEERGALKEGPKEVLKLSKSEPPAGASGDKGAARAATKSLNDRLRLLEEEATVREKTLTEANERIAQLEKTISDMQKLIQLKAGPGLAPSQPDAAPKPEPAQAEPAPPPAAATLKPEPAPPAITKKEPPKPQTVAPPPPPSLIEEILDEPLYLAGGGGVLVALLGIGYGAWRRRRARPAVAAEEPKLAPKLAPAAVPAMASAAAAALPEAAPVTAAATLPSEADLFIDEADMFLRLGRDGQAEERLKEAVQKEPGRQDAQLKLLEIYAMRRDKDAFAKIASALSSATGGKGDNWLKVAAMGFALDPGNPLYEAGRSAPAAALATTGPVAATDLDFDLDLSGAAAGPTATDVTLETAPMPTPETEKTMVLQPGAMQSIVAEVVPEAQHAPEVLASLPDIAFDLGGAASGDSKQPDIAIDGGAAPALVPDLHLESAPANPTTSVIDFSLDIPAVEPPEAGKPEPEEKALALNMNFDLGEPAQPGALDWQPAKTAQSPEPDFTLDLPQLDLDAVPTAAAVAPEMPPPVAVPGLDLSSISLTLDKASKQAPAAVHGKDEHWFDVQTKFDLAKAYREMGDKDGAREILEEVLKEGDAGQQIEAKKMLENLG